MKTVELSAALGQAQVVENLKNFVGVDAQGAAALMTPERLAAVAGEFAGKGYADDLNNEMGYFTVGMFNKSSKNIPSFDEGVNSVGVFANFRAKFSGGVFMFQIAIPLGQPAMFVRILWNQTWYSWRMCKMIDQMNLNI